MIAGRSTAGCFSQLRTRDMRSSKACAGDDCDYLKWTFTAILVGWLGLLVSCQGLPPNVANCPITPTPPSNISVIPPAAEPPPQALCGFPVAISSPANGATVSSPAPILATATPPDPLYTMRIYVDGQAVLFSFTPNVNQYIWMADGQHTIEVVAQDEAGYIATSSIQVNVTGQDPGVPNVQNLPWLSCSNVLATGLTCAVGIGGSHVVVSATSGSALAGWICSSLFLGWQSTLLERTLLEPGRGWKQRQPFHLRSLVLRQRRERSPGTGIRPKSSFRRDSLDLWHRVRLRPDAQMEYLG